MRLIGGGHGAGPVIGDSPPNPLEGILSGTKMVR
jgi:hypothetical protein